MCLDDKSTVYEREVLKLHPPTHNPGVILQVLIVIRALCIILMLLFNAFMWNIFVKSLQKCNSTILPTLVNNASNFFCTVGLRANNLAEPHRKIGGVWTL